MRQSSTSWLYADSAQPVAPQQRHVLGEQNLCINLQPAQQLPCILALILPPRLLLPLILQRICTCAAIVVLTVLRRPLFSSALGAPRSGSTAPTSPHARMPSLDSMSSFDGLGTAHLTTSGAASTGSLKNKARRYGHPAMLTCDVYVRSALPRRGPRARKGGGLRNSVHRAPLRETAS